MSPQDASQLVQSPEGSSPPYWGPAERAVDSSLWGALWCETPVRVCRSLVGVAEACPLSSMQKRRGNQGHGGDVALHSPMPSVVGRGEAEFQFLGRGKCNWM